MTSSTEKRRGGLSTRARPGAVLRLCGSAVMLAAGLAAGHPAGEEDRALKGGEWSLSEAPVSLVKVAEMVHRGHVYLAGVQNPDGSFSVDPRSPEYAESAPIAVTALTCLSFMAGGSTPACGPFRRELSKGLRYLISVCDPETGIFHDDLDDHSKMHGQGFAMLALAEAYGMYGLGNDARERRGIRAALKGAVGLVSRIQTEVGGWYYTPYLTSEHEGSITICIVEALRAARNAGIHVDKGVIERAVQYVRRSQKKSDGSFRYRLGDDKTSYALTAAAVATLNASGVYDSKAIDRGIAYMLSKDPLLHDVTIELYPQYARFYAAQAYWQYKDLSTWQRWYPLLVEECARRQDTDGSFSNPKFGSVYATAMTTLTLQVPFGYLPVFQR